jgi:hypothetical protein
MFVDRTCDEPLLQDWYASTAMIVICLMTTIAFVLEDQQKPAKYVHVQ